MQIITGKHAGKTSEEVILKHADYVDWYLGTYPAAALGREFKRLIAEFDAKPFTMVCWSCKQPATYATVYRENTDFMYWCDDCDPYGTGARHGQLTRVRTYTQALNHIHSTARGRKGDLRDTIRELAKGKGLPARVGKQQAKDFFK